MSEEITPYAVSKGPLDTNVERVRAKLLLRSQLGFKKYGCTTERTDLDLLCWLRHLQEELLDASIYVERLMRDVQQQRFEIGDLEK